MNGSFIFFLLIAIIIIMILQVLWETDIAVSLFHRPLVSFSVLFRVRNKGRLEMKGILKLF